MVMPAGTMVGEDDELIWRAASARLQETYYRAVIKLHGTCLAGEGLTRENYNALADSALRAYDREMAKAERRYDVTMDALPIWAEARRAARAEHGA